MSQPMPRPLPKQHVVPRGPRGSRTSRPRRSVARRILLVLAVLIVVLAVAAGGGWFWFRGQLEASLPQLDGERAIAGLSAPVEIERDDLGVPTIRAATRADAARALGFLHAQDRFFQMDLLRRQAAGELAELFGPAALETDKEHRVHRFRDVARRVVAMAAGEERAVLDAYAAGVNAGLAALGSKPFEYLATGTDPAPWKAEDSILAVHAMFIELNDENGTSESNLGVLHDMLPPEMFELLAPRGTEWDAPIVGPPFVTPPIPGPEVFNLRRGLSPATPATPAKAAAFRPEPPGESSSALGSNNWAVAGTHTADGRALLADDMHLGIRVPNTWYRASIVRPDGRGGSLRLTGVTLPGTPMVAVGSNGHVAWGFTNSYGDWTDLVVLERTDARDPDLYRTPEGPKRLRKVAERIRVKGEKEATLEVKESVWGPVIDTDAQGRPRVLAWTAHHPEAVNLRGVTGLEDGAQRGGGDGGGEPLRHSTSELRGGRFGGADRLDDHGPDAAPPGLRRPRAGLLGGRLEPLGRLACAGRVSARGRSPLGPDLDGQLPGGGRRHAGPPGRRRVRPGRP